MVFNDKKKDKINVLLNPDNFYGKSNANTKRVLIFLASVSIPFIIYSVAIMPFIPLRFFLPLFLVYTIRMAMVILGREKERVESYIKQLRDQYSSAKNLMNIYDPHEDGVIEYQNGTICYILKCYTFSYMSDNKFSLDVEKFLTKMYSLYNADIYIHLVLDELGFKQEDYEKLNVYENHELLKERLEFYKYTNSYSNDNSMLYCINIVVKSYKSNWGKFKQDIDALVNSDMARCFASIKVCNREEAVDVISRDLTLFVDLHEMLQNKHDSNDYADSAILFFGDKPEDDTKDYEVFKEEEGRRVINDK